MTDPTDDKLEINTNVTYMRTWFERTPTGLRGMFHAREVTRDGRTIRDEIGETGVVATWTAPVPFWLRLFSEHS